jgi:hypothetical protein
MKSPPVPEALETKARYGTLGGSAEKGPKVIVDVFEEVDGSPVGADQVQAWRE